MRLSSRSTRVQLIVAALLLSAAPVFANPVEDAYRICSSVEQTGLTTDCKVNGWSSTVDITIDTNGEEARKICSGIADQMAQRTRSFGGKWKLRILSPYSGEKAIAVCTLR
jgi:hypothetical protein